MRKHLKPRTDPGYEAFGTRTTESGTNLDRQKANTKEEDPTGLLNEGFRYRDLETGMFISRDPMGFVDGPNVYTYVRQNPWTMFDPLGLREANETEKAGLEKMDELASSIRDEATKLDEKGKTESPVKGDPLGMTESQLEANRLRGEAGEIDRSARMIKEAIDALGEGEMSNRMAYVNEAFSIWTNPERNGQFLPGGSVRWSGDGVFGDNNKCNIFLHLCLRASNPASRLTFGGKGKDAFNAGYWANDKNNPGGLFPPAAIQDGERNTILINNGDPGLGGANYTAQPGDVLSFGAANAGQDGAHVALSLGGNTMINGSYSPPGGGWPAQQPSVNIKLLNSQEGRRRVIRQSK